jgi:transposase-like protein
LSVLLWLKLGDEASGSTLETLDRAARSRRLQKNPALRAITAVPPDYVPRVIPFFAFPMQVRKVLYTTNAIESLHMQLRKIVKNRGHFPSDEAALKLLYLALTKIEQKWRSGGSVEWKAALAQFAVLFEDRFAAVGG